MGDMLIRGVDQVVVDNIKLVAKQRGLSVNRLVSDSLAELFAGDVKQRYHDLDVLAGTWSKRDLESFEKSIEPLTKADKDMWPSGRVKPKK